MAKTTLEPRLAIGSLLFGLGLFSVLTRSGPLLWARFLLSQTQKAAP